MKKNILFITGGRWQVPGVIRAKELGYETIVIDGSPHAEALKIADHSACININNLSEIYGYLDQLHLTPDGVISYCSEVGMLAAASVRDTFNLPGASLAITKKLVDKYEQRKIWKEENVENTKWLFLEGGYHSKYESLILDYIPLPCIIKPTDSSGSRGVTKVERKEEIKYALHEAFKFSKNKKVLVEEYFDGVEYTVETFNINGQTHVLIITEKDKVAGSRGVVAQELYTPKLTAAELEMIKNKVIKATQALKYKDGPGHTEVIFTKKKTVELVEMAGRGGGFGVFDKMIPLVSEINVVDLLIQQSVGNTVEINSQEIKNDFFSLKFFPSLKSGIITNISGFEEANSRPSVWASSFVEIGERVESNFCDGSRLGYALIKASTREQLNDKINEVNNLVSFEVS